MTTKTAQVRALADDGVGDAQIAEQLGIPERRVAAILDSQAAKPHVRIQWLAPAGPDGEPLIEYALPAGLGNLRRISADEARTRMQDGERVLARRTTPWAPIPDIERTAS